MCLNVQYKYNEYIIIKQIVFVKVLLKNLSPVSTEFILIGACQTITNSDLYQNPELKFLDIKKPLIVVV